MPYHVELVRPPDTIATAWRGAATRDPLNRPWSYERLDTIAAKFGGKSSTPVQDSVWACPPGHAAALGQLDELMRAHGSRGVRLTELGRAWAFQARERAKYDAWVKARRPDPASSRYVRGEMRTTFIARPGESMHQSGCAIDIDVEALDFPDVPDREQLAMFWKIAQHVGYRPIIAEPDPHQSECWHFDWFPPPVARIYAGLRRRDALAYPHTALALAVLTGRYTGDDASARLVQARLLLDGYDVGWTDGIIGPRTVAWLEAVGIAGAGTMSSTRILEAMDDLGVGVAEMREI